VETYYLHFQSATIAEEALRKLSETNIKQFNCVMGIKRDPGNNPEYLELSVDYYISWTMGSIFRFLEVAMDVVTNGRIIDRFYVQQLPMPAARDDNYPPTPATIIIEIGTRFNIAA